MTFYGTLKFIQTLTYKWNRPIWIIKIQNERQKGKNEATKNRSKVFPHCYHTEDQSFCLFFHWSVTCLPSFVSLFSQVFLDCSLRGSLVKLISPSYPLPNLWIFAFFFNQLYTFRKHFLYFPSLLRFLVLGHFLSCLLTFQTFCSLFLSFSFA